MGKASSKKRVRRDTKATSRKLLPVGFAPIVGFDLEKWFLDAGLCPEAETYVRNALAAPSRYLSGYMSHTIHYPCAKFGYSIKFESRNFEYPFGLINIYRSDVLVVVEQPGKLGKIVLEKGWTDPTPDLLVLTVEGVELWEVKPNAKVAEKVVDGSYVYVERDGRFFSPAIEERCAKWKFKYRVATEADVNSTFAKAAHDLHPYIKGFPKNPITDEERSKFIEWVNNNPGRRLGAMAIDATRRIELAQYLIAQGQVFTSLSELDFNAPNAIRLFPTPQDEVAFHQYLEESRPRPANLEELGYRLCGGALIEIGWRDFEVEKLSKTMIELRDVESGELRQLSHHALLALKPRIGKIVGAEKMFDTLFHTADLEDRLTYTARKQMIRRYLPGGDWEDKLPEERTIREYRDRYVDAERAGLSGDEAIFPRFDKCGRKPTKFEPEIQKEFDALLKKHLFDPRNSTVKWMWRELSAKFSGEKLGSERTIFRRVEAIDKYRRGLAALGKGGASEFEPVFGDSPTLGSPHGRRALTRVHIDSSPVDLTHPDDDRQYVAHMVDAFTKKIVARICTDEPPCGLTIRALILDCVARYGFVPAEISCDFGSEHRTTWLIKSLMELDVVLDIRPKKSGRKGGPVEVSFKDLCVLLIHNLPGNTKFMREIRLVTEAVKADKFATLSAEELRELHEAYCVLRNDIPHGNNPSPNALEQASIEKLGMPPHQRATVEEMQDALLPFVYGTRRKVSQRGTIRCNKDIYGIVGEMSPLARHRGEWVDVRWKPEDHNTVYAYPKSPRKAIRCQCVNASGPSADIIARATALDAEAPKSPQEKQTEFVTMVETKVTAAKKARKTQAKIVQFPGSEGNAGHDDDEIQTYDFNS